jgi:hypothetical protein
MGGVMRAEHQNFRNLVMRISTALALKAAAFVEAKRRRG